MQTVEQVGKQVSNVEMAREAQIPPWLALYRNTFAHGTGSSVISLLTYQDLVTKMFEYVKVCYRYR